MKNPLTRSVLLFLAMSIVLFSCRNTSSDKENDTVTVSILPFAYFVGEIAGQDISVNVIVPPGASPATFEPPPSVISGLRNSDAVIFDGYLGFEMAWMEKLMQVNREIPVLHLADSQNLIAADSHTHGDHVHLAGVDPHFWMSPLAARQIARDITTFLSGVYLDKSSLFQSSLENLLQKIDSVDSYCSERLGALSGNSFLIFHPALTYFARDYNLNQVPIEYEGKEPSAAWMKSVIDLATDKGIEVILVQEEFNRKSAETIASEIGGKVVVVRPLSENWDEAVREVADAIAGSAKK